MSNPKMHPSSVSSALAYAESVTWQPHNYRAQEECHPHVHLQCHNHNETYCLFNKLRQAANSTNGAITQYQNAKNSGSLNLFYHLFPLDCPLLQGGITNSKPITLESLTFSPAQLKSEAGILLVYSYQFWALDMLILR